MPHPDGTLNSQELVRDLLADGWSQSRIARAVGRDSRVVSQIARGEKPYTNLTRALEQLATTGQVTTPPPRRRTSDGRVANVRGSAGGPAVRPPLVPPAPVPRADRPTVEPSRSRSTDQPGRRPRAVEGRNDFEFIPHIMPGGRESIRVRFPPRNQGRVDEANDRFTQIIERGTEAGRRMQAMVIIETGSGANKERHQIALGSKGGYNVAAVQDALQDHGGSFLDWIDSQVAADRYAGIAGSSGARIIAVDLDLW